MAYEVVFETEDTMTILMIATAAVSGFMLLLIVLGGLYIILSKYWIERREVMRWAEAVRPDELISDRKPVGMYGTRVPSARPTPIPMTSVTTVR